MRRIVLLPVLAGAMVAPAEAQDPAAGEQAYRRCQACHQIGPNARHVIGPHLNGLFQRRAGSAEGFRFSQALLASPLSRGPWAEDDLRKYLREPRAVLPGTTMTFAGVRNDRDLDDLIAFLRSFDAQGRRVAN